MGVAKICGFYSQQRHLRSLLQFRLLTSLIHLQRYGTDFDLDVLSLFRDVNSLNRDTLPLD